MTVEEAASGCDARDEDVPDKFAFVDDIDSLECCLDILMACPSIALDAEGTYLSRYGKLCTLQIGIPTGQEVLEEVYIVDIISLGEQAFDHCNEDEFSLRGILESTSVVKYMWDCRMDTDALFHQYNITLQSVIDLQISEVALRRQSGQSAPRVAGLRACLDKYLAKSDVQEIMPFRTATIGIKQMFDANPRSWEVRPLGVDQIVYAAIDVAYMHKLADMVHGVLTPDLKEVVKGFSEERSRWHEESDDKALHDGNERAIAPTF